MPNRTALSPLTELTSRLPDFTSSPDLSQVRTDLYEVLMSRHIKVNGEKAAYDSSASNIRASIRAVAITRQVDLNMRELAVSRGVDVNTASATEIAISASSDEIQSLLTMVESTISPERITEVVTNKEMAEIESKELRRNRNHRDWDWSRDTTSLVSRAVPHFVERMIHSPEDGKSLFIVENVAVKLDSIIAEVDENGEVCVWMYEEPTLSEE